MTELLSNYGPITESWFAIEIPDGLGGWKTIYAGGKIGGDSPPITFKPVTASKVRLDILRAAGGPTIWDFELYDSKPAGK